jgi:hypothetical protein
MEKNKDWILILGGNVGTVGCLGRVIHSGDLRGAPESINTPTSYGTIIRFVGYYTVFLCFSYTGNVLWIGGYQEHSSTVSWYRVFG